MKDATTFTITMLKEHLRRLNVSTAGNKMELISRLHKSDPSSQWINDTAAEASETGEASGFATAVYDTEASDQRPRSPVRRSLMRSSTLGDSVIWRVEKGSIAERDRT